MSRREPFEPADGYCPCNLPAGRETNLLLSQPSDDSIHPNRENVADTYERPDCDGTPCFDLLPVPRRETERDHVLLVEAALLPQPADSLMPAVCASAQTGRRDAQQQQGSYKSIYGAALCSRCASQEQNDCFHIPVSEVEAQLLARYGVKRGDQVVARERASGNA